MKYCLKTHKQTHKLYPVLHLSVFGRRMCTDTFVGCNLNVQTGFGKDFNRNRVGHGIVKYWYSLLIQKTLCRCISFATTSTESPATQKRLSHLHFFSSSFILPFLPFHRNRFQSNLSRAVWLVLQLKRKKKSWLCYTAEFCLLIFGLKTCTPSFNLESLWGS